MSSRGEVTPPTSGQLNRSRMSGRFPGKGLPPAAGPPQARAVTAKIWKWPLANQILFGLVIGAALGVVAQRTVTEPESLLRLQWWLANLIQPVGRVFIRIIFMIVIPLIF